MWRASKAVEDKITSWETLRPYVCRWTTSDNTRDWHQDWTCMRLMHERSRNMTSQEASRSCARTVRVIQVSNHSIKHMTYWCTSIHLLHSQVHMCMSSYHHCQNMMHYYCSCVHHWCIHWHLYKGSQKYTQLNTIILTLIVEARAYVLALHSKWTVILSCLICQWKRNAGKRGTDRTQCMWHSWHTGTVESIPNISRVASTIITAISVHAYCIHTASWCSQ